MTFSEVHLNRKEMRLLRRAKTKQIDVSSAPRLLEHKFVQELKTENPGYMPAHTGKATATQKGVDYLAYRRGVFNHLFWIPFTVALATSLLSTGIVNFLLWIR